MHHHTQRRRSHRPPPAQAFAHPVTTVTTRFTARFIHRTAPQDPPLAGQPRTRSVAQARHVAARAAAPLAAVRRTPAPAIRT